jgi:hypothetical protein
MDHSLAQRIYMTTAPADDQQGVSEANTTLTPLSRSPAKLVLPVVEGLSLRQHEARKSTHALDPCRRSLGSPPGYGRSEVVDLCRVGSRELERPVRMGHPSSIPSTADERPTKDDSSRPLTATCTCSIENLDLPDWTCRMGATLHMHLSSPRV